MTTERIDTDRRQACLDWMRAEFRAAQQRRYETSWRVPVKEARVAKPKPASEAESPTLATPLQQNVPNSTDV